MIKLITMTAAALSVAALGVSMVLAVPAGHSSAAAHRAACGAFWRDGSGSGSSTSLVPGSHPSDGDKVVQAGSDAWRIRYFASEGTLYPCSAPGFCYAANSGKVVIRTCDLTHDNQHWTQIVRNGVSQFQNQATQTLLAASGGIGTQDVVTNGGTAYHNHWKPEPGP